MKTTTMLILGFALMTVLQPASARDRDRDRHHYQQPWAEYYAQTSMGQVREMHKLGCYHQGDRWSYDYYKHLHWASRHSQNKAQYEIQRRNQRLLECYNSQHHYADNRAGRHRDGHNAYPRPYYQQNDVAYWQSRYSLSYSKPYNDHGKFELGLAFKH